MKDPEFGHNATQSYIDFYNPSGKRIRFGVEGVTLFLEIDETKSGVASEMSDIISSQYLVFTHGGVSFRTGNRDGYHVLDQVITEIGFSGEEGVDWVTLTADKLEV